MPELQEKSGSRPANGKGGFAALSIIVGHDQDDVRARGRIRIGMRGRGAQERNDRN
jgi:hypothetical protein